MFGDERMAQVFWVLQVAGTCMGQGASSRSSSQADSNSDNTASASANSESQGGLSVARSVANSEVRLVTFSATSQTARD